jgi:hypothetical protein
MGRSSGMRVSFVEATTAKEALKMVSHPVSKIVKVEGGYRCFESVEDCRVWRQQK